ncbi:MAG: nucleotidyltransferase domain-containing protein [Elusimicrobia bacterium]|nr:nucleotidyltransferase domain-containing protein [Elusimicrobiota bacterium]
MSNLSKILLEQIIKKILEEADPDKIVLFGSMARNDDMRSSDIDIALFGVERMKAIVIKDKLNDQIESLRDFDVIAFDSLKNKPLKNKIIQEGITVYERRSGPQAG